MIARLTVRSLRALELFVRNLLDGPRARGVTLRDVTQARPTTGRHPIFAIAAICLAVLGLALPRFGGPSSPESTTGGNLASVGAASVADSVRGAWTGDSDEEPAGDAAGFAAPIASVADVAAVLQRATEAVERLPIELGCSKARVLPAHVRPDATRVLVVGDPVRVAEREVAAHGSPLLRWRLAHSTSSAIG